MANSMEGELNQVDTSLIVEWENSRHTVESRTAQMMRRLAQQVEERLAAGNASFELIIVYDPGDCPEQSIRTMLNEQWRSLLSSVHVSLVPVADGSYYVMKNVAAATAKGEFIVFIDCDVLPEPHWLDNILAPFDDPEIGVSQGATFVQPHSALTKGLALAWLFPLRRSDGRLSEEDRVIANNIAFRRSVFLRFPYPDLATWRGQCTAQRRMLEKHGIGVHWSGTARTIHPFPIGLSGTIERACLNGHDHAMRDQERGVGSPWKESYWRFHSFLKRASRRRADLREDLALSVWDEFVCVLVAFGYWGVALISECGLHLFPTAWRKLLKELPKNYGDSASVANEGQAGGIS